MAKENKKVSTQTTGHVWDDDLQEYNNPLPRWWIWGLYATMTFAIVYWLLYPAWPLLDSYTKGLSGLNTITYTATKVKQQKHKALLIFQLTNTITKFWILLKKSY